MRLPPKAIHRVSPIMQYAEETEVDVILALLLAQSLEKAHVGDPHTAIDSLSHVQHDT